MALGTDKSSLADRLASILPKHHNFTIYHISTPPTRSAALYAAPPNSKPERTYTESHFLSVAIKAPKEVLVLAIEVLIYTTKHLTTIFVSKADSTGYLHLSGIVKGHESPLRTISTNFLEFLVETRQRKGKKLVLSLFARASDQYLFPGSVENEKKHVSDDRQLIKWWCRVLDPVLRKYPSAEGERTEEENVTSQAYLIIPGEDSIAPYIPPAVRLDPQLRKRWKHGHPLREISQNPAAPPRCLIPHFPDDPKARFLDELDDELPDNSSQNIQDSPNKKGNGRWKSVRSLEQFWETMAFRQECSSGRLVGFVWVVFTPADEASSQGMVETQESQVSTLSKSSKLGTPPRLSPTRHQPPITPHRHSASCSHGTKKRRPLRGPIIPRTPKIKQSSSSSSSRRSIDDIPEETPYYLWPTTSRGTLVFSDKDYKKATENLLSLQFKNLESAMVSTRSWVEEVRVLSGKMESGSWGFVVLGGKEAGMAAVGKANGNGNGGGVNTLMAVKKKRKAGDEGKDIAENGVNTLGAGLVKKKKRVQLQEV
jgi:regulator of Ty1 transposition protein 109